MFFLHPIVDTLHSICCVILEQNTRDSSSRMLSGIIRTSWDESRPTIRAPSTHAFGLLGKSPLLPEQSKQLTTDNLVERRTIKHGVNADDLNVRTKGMRSLAHTTCYDFSSALPCDHAPQASCYEPPKPYLFLACWNRSIHTHLARAFSGPSPRSAILCPEAGEEGPGKQTARRTVRRRQPKMRIRVGWDEVAGLRQRSVQRVGMSRSPCSNRSVSSIPICSRTHTTR